MTTAVFSRLHLPRARDRQRLAHLAAGVALIAYVYIGPVLGAGFTAAVQWVVIPVVGGSGLALWKWPRIRRFLRERSRR